MTCDDASAQGRHIERLREAPTDGAAGAEYQAAAALAGAEIVQARMWLAGAEAADPVDPWRLLAAGTADQRRVQRDGTLVEGHD